LGLLDQKEKEKKSAVDYFEKILDYEYLRKTNDYKIANFIFSPLFILSLVKENYNIGA